jgi:hypothetical protein
VVGCVTIAWRAHVHPPLCGRAQAPHIFPYITVPLYISENQADSNQIFNQTDTPMVNNATVVAYVNYYAQQMRVRRGGPPCAPPAARSHTHVVVGAPVPPSLALQESLHEALTSGAASGFSPACLAHTANTGLNSYTLINFVSLPDSFRAWWTGSNKSPTVLVDTCQPVSVRRDARSLRTPQPASRPHDAGDVQPHLSPVAHWCGAAGAVELVGRCWLPLPGMVMALTVMGDRASASGCCTRTAGPVLLAAARVSRLPVSCVVIVKYVPPTSPPPPPPAARLPPGVDLINRAFSNASGGINLPFAHWVMLYDRFYAPAGHCY